MSTPTKKIATIVTPLGFFVLSLLIVESFLAVVLLGQANCSNSDFLLWSGIGLFIFVVLIVSLLVLMKPEALVFDQSGHLEKILSERIDDLKIRQKVEEYLRQASMYRILKSYSDARMFYEKALALDSANEEAKIGLAVSYSYEKPDDLSRPISLLSEVITKNPNSYKAVFNRACLYVVSGSEKKYWLHDLKNAISLNPEFKEIAKKDPDFDSVRSDTEFLELLK